MSEILVVHSELPLHDRHSGSLRLFRILELLAGEGHRVTFVARAGLGQDRYVAELERLGIEVHPVDPERLLDARGIALALPALDFPALLARSRFDVALLSFYDLAEQYLPLIRAHSPLTRVVVDTVDVHWVREQRGAELTGDPARLAAAEGTRLREQAVYGAADALVAVSDDDARALRELAPGVPVAVVSNVHADAPAGPAFRERDGVVFVGNFGHAPNVDAVVDFHANVWPRVRAALPGARLTLAGTDPPAAVQALAGDSVRVTGWVPETTPYLDAARVSVAPLRYGAGVKGKIGEALSRGLPVVTTSIGAEGMGLVDGEHALVRDDPEELAAAIVELHGDRALWERLAVAGRDHVRARLGRPAARESLRALLHLTVRASLLAPPTWLEPDALVAVLGGYLRAFTSDDAVSLVLGVDPGADMAAAFSAVSTTIAELGHDPEDIPDILVSPLSGPAPLPRTTVRLGEDIALDAPASAWRAAAGLDAPQRRRPSAPSAAVLVHLEPDPQAARLQLDALASAGLGDDVEVIIAADAPDDATDAALAGASGALVLRSAIPVGRSAVLQRAAEAARADVLVALAPGTLPRAGFLAPVVDAVRAGAALAAPVVDGAHGYRAAHDGSLWPAAAGERVDALAFDCLAALRESLIDGLPELLGRDGHAELQVARWAAERGPLAVATASAVDRIAGPPASVVVCTRDRAEELEDSVELLVASDVGRRGGEIVLLDNASSDDTAQVCAELAARHPGIVRCAHAADPGLYAARNGGAQAARHELLLFVDDDARVAPGWLEHLSWALMRPGVAIAGGPICALWPPEREPHWPDAGLEPLLSVLDAGDASRSLEASQGPYGANWAIRASVLRAVGGFLEGFGPSPGVAINGDEVSVGSRVHRGGHGRSLFVPGAGVGHRIHPSRVSDRFLLERSLRVGVERVRHAVALDGVVADRLLGGAQGAANRLLHVVPLAGELSVEDAFAAIDGVALSLRVRAYAADALGELSASAVALGEREVSAGALRLAVRPEHAGGVLARTAA